MSRLLSSRVAVLRFSAALGCALALGLFAHPVAAQQPAGGAIATVAPGDDLNAIFRGLPCSASKSLTQFDAPLARTARRLDAGEPISIVAIGSSSTAGAGASSPAFSYPSRLGRELGLRFPRSAVTVVNLGANGEEANDMLARMDSALERHPDLVIWQLGTNAVLRDVSVATTAEQMRAGIARIRASGADVLIVDPQFAPSVNAKPTVHLMVDEIDAVARRTHVPVFRRYVAMRHWHEDQAIAFDRFISADGLHMNDWGYACLARLLADNIATAVIRSRTVADVKTLAP